MKFNSLSDWMSIWLVLIGIKLRCANSWTERSYPNPRNVRCYPKGLFTPYVCDPDKVLSHKDRKIVSAELTRLSTLTKCECPSDRQERCYENSKTGYVIGMALLKNRPININNTVLSDQILLRKFSQSVRSKWNLGHCQDDAVIVVCQQCKQAVLLHGEATRKKIPDSVRERMEFEATNIFSLANANLTVTYLLKNYRRLLSMMKNETPSASALLLPYESVSVGVITVMYLTSILSAVWAVCVAFLAVKFLRKHHSRHSEVSREKDEYSMSHFEQTTTTSPDSTQKYQFTPRTISYNLGQLQPKRFRVADNFEDPDSPAAASSSKSSCFWEMQKTSSQADTLSRMATCSTMEGAIFLDDDDDSEDSEQQERNLLSSKKLTPAYRTVSFTDSYSRREQEEGKLRRDTDQGFKLSCPNMERRKH